MEDPLSSRDFDELITRLRAGDAVALAELLELWRGRCLRIVEARLDHRVRRRLDPADVLQEAYLDLAGRLPKFCSEQESMTPFVWIRLVITERVLITNRKNLLVEARDARREVVRGSPISSSATVVLASHLIAQVSSVSGRVIRAEMAEAVLETINSLDAMDQEIILLRSFEELTNAEAAEVLGLSVNATSNRFVRAMTRLKRALAAIPGFME